MYNLGIKSFFKSDLFHWVFFSLKSLIATPAVYSLFHVITLVLTFPVNRFFNQFFQVTDQKNI